MNTRVIAYLLAFPVGLMGLAQTLFGLLSLFVFHDHLSLLFLGPGMAMLAFATLCWALAKRTEDFRISYKDSLFFATATWVISGVLGAIPVVEVTGVSITDGIFESISGLTTTGATMLTGLDHMPPSFLMYRQALQWMGGLGVVIFVVAILPMLNVGGMRLLQAEMPGPIKDEKLSPRVAHTAHYLWIVYVLITVLCAIGYQLTGMSGYDAIAHSLTTVSTGGFSTHDSSLGYFDSPNILLVADLFMLVGAISFALHFKVLSTRKLILYGRDEETRVFISIVCALSAVLAGLLMATGTYTEPLAALSDSAFHLISFLTSTGFGAASFTEWPDLAKVLLVIAATFGGCAGSTAGGNKIIRIIISAKSIGLEMKKLLHPNGVFLMKYQGRPLGRDIVSATAGFIVFATVSTALLTVAMTGTGLDVWSSFTAVVACLNVLGPAFGELGSNFQPVSDVGTWILSFAMILGRLEYLTVFAIFLPSFWRK